MVILNDPSAPTFEHFSTPFRDCIDYAIASAAAGNILSCVLGEDVGSDHLPLLVTRPRPQNQTPPPASTSFRRWRTSTLGWSETFAANLEREVQERQLLQQPIPLTPRAVDSLAEAVEDAVVASADACLQRSRHRGDTRATPLPWWCRLLITERRRLRRQLSRPRSSGDEGTRIRQQLGTLRNQIRRGVQEARRDRVVAKSAVFAQGPKESTFWPCVKRWFRGPAIRPPPLVYNDSPPASTPADRASSFAGHLAQALAVHQHPDFDQQAFEETEEDVELDPLFRPAASLRDEPDFDQSEPAGPVSPHLVALELRKLRGGKAPGPDGISTDLLKAAPFAFAIVLATLFTGSFRVGYVPRRWRVAWIRMLPKPGKALTSPAHYRPVAMSSCIGKVLERIFTRRLHTFCHDRGLLPEEQSGFRPGRDTLEQVVLLSQRAAQAMNAGSVLSVAALDVSKAYDSVWHRGLLFQLRETISEPSCRWIAGFLQDRTAAVMEGGYLSAHFPTPGGVPQGSPLSPLLYVLYTRTMPLPRAHPLGATAYADDVAVWAVGTTPADAWSKTQPILAGLIAWGLRWRLTFSPEKTQACFFSRRAGGWTEEELGTPSFGSTTLQWKTSVDLLGVRLDRRLQIQAHADWVSQRVGPRILDFRRLVQSQRVPAWVGLLLYRSMIRPCLTYAAPILPLACDSAWEALDRLERHGLRAALRARLDTPIQDLRRRSAALGELKDECRRLAGRFLGRHVRGQNLRLLSAFRTEMDQHANRVHVSGPLERLLAWVPPDKRAAISTWVRDHVPPPNHQQSGRPTRAFLPASSASDWGESPF